MDGVKLWMMYGCFEHHADMVREVKQERDDQRKATTHFCGGRVLASCAAAASVATPRYRWSRIALFTLLA